MRRLPTTSRLLAMGAFALAAFGLSAGSVAAAGSTISGTVTSAGAGVAGATIDVYDANTWDLAVSATSGASGTYATAALPAGSYFVVVEAPDGFLGGGWWTAGGLVAGSDAATVVVLNGTTVRTGVNAALTRITHLSGTVAGEGGAAVEGAAVTACTPDETMCASDVAAAGGTFSLSIESPGSYLVQIDPPEGSALASGYYSSTATGKWTASGATATPVVMTTADRAIGTVTLPLPRTITGTLVAATGAKLAGMDVALVTPDLSDTVDSTATDANGAFTFTGTPGSSYKLQVSASAPYKDGYYAAAGAAHFTTSSSAAATIAPTGPLTALGSITVERSYVMTGTIVGANGAGAIDDLSVVACTALGACLDSVPTDAAGAFAIADANPGSAYRLEIQVWNGRYPASGWYVAGTVTHYSLSVADGTFVMMPAADKPLGTITLPRRWVISGRIMAENAAGTGVEGPAPDTRVDACRVAEIECRWTTAATDGTYSIDTVEPGTYTIEVTASPSAMLADGWYAATVAGTRYAAAEAAASAVPVSADTALADLVLPRAFYVTGTASALGSSVSFTLTRVGSATPALEDYVSGSFAWKVVPGAYTLRADVSDGRFAETSWYNAGAVGHLASTATTVTVGRATLALGTLTPPPAAGDRTPPTVTAHAPATGATGVARNATATVTFSEAVTGVASSSLRLIDDTAGIVLPATTTYNATTFGATIRASALLPAGHAIRIAGSGAIVDKAGNPFAGAIGTFKVTTDAARPKVSSHVPATNARSVSRTANLTIRFSEAVRGVSSSTIRLKDTRTGKYVTASVTYSSATHVATLNPRLSLTSLRKFQVIVSAKILDLAGNPLTALAWYFTTRR